MSTSMDWPTTVSEFHRMFENRRTNRKPAGLRGTNFMTNEFLGYVKCPGGPVEISTGMFLQDRIFGVTFPTLEDGSPNPRSQCCHSLDEVLAVITADA